MIDWNQRICYSIIWFVTQQKSSGAMYVILIAPLMIKIWQDIRNISIQAIESSKLFSTQPNIKIDLKKILFVLNRFHGNNMTKIHYINIQICLRKLNLLIKHLMNLVMQNNMDQMTVVIVQSNKVLKVVQM